MANEAHPDGYLSYTASLITQGRHRFYTLTIPSDVLARTCFVIDRDEDPVEGFQRLLNRDRAQQIADYIDAGFGTIPTSIVLSAQAVSEFEYTRKTRTVRFRDTAVKPILSLFGEAEINNIYNVLCSYLTAFLGKASERELSLDVTSPIVFRALLYAFPDIAQRVRDRSGTDYSSDNFAVVIGDMLKNVKHSSIKNVGNSVSGGTSGAVTFALRTQEELLIAGKAA